jgi:dTDP-4-amino-4,6-dideoxygalactose transaminase
VSIPFNKPYATGIELQNISEAIASGETAGNGPFTKKCHEILSSEFGFKKPLLTSSCTDALEMSALLIDIKPGDEVIVPAYTFVSTALAFARQGAKIIFADSRKDNPCIDVYRIEQLITEKTRAIVPVHYAGIACDMDAIMEIAGRHNLYVIEDAAHAFGAFYKGRPLGTIGNLGCLSFHETKIIHCGEGGMLSVNDEKFSKRAEVVWEKGTNRSAFHNGEVKKYEWLDTGSSFLMSDISAAFLLSQIKATRQIIIHRKQQWELYYNLLKDLEIQKKLILPGYPDYSGINFSVFFLIISGSDKADKLKSHLNSIGIQALTHYLDLSRSPYISNSERSLIRVNNPNTQKYQDTLLRLPLFYDLTEKSIIEVADSIKSFYRNDND